MTGALRWWARKGLSYPIFCDIVPSKMLSIKVPPINYYYKKFTREKLHQIADAARIKDTIKITVYEKLVQ